VGQAPGSRLQGSGRVIALDTNLLVYAHREDSRWHEAAFRMVSQIAEGRGAWAVPWPCIHEFLAIVTHPCIYRPPTPLPLALDQVSAWMESPSLVLLGESGGYWEHARALIEAGKVAGAQVHDARVAPLCLHHGVEELLTADRDFSRFPDLEGPQSPRWLIRRLVADPAASLPSASPAARSGRRRDWSNPTRCRTRRSL